MAGQLTITDLAEVAHSAGKVFEGMTADLLDTENFLRTGSTEGVNSRADLALLEDLRDVATWVIDHNDQPVDAAFVRSLNAQMTRSGALRPGEFRTASQNIGVSTRYGRHLPSPQSDASLQRIVDEALSRGDPVEGALDLFVQVAKAQPFEDGNKRTALFAANAHLLGKRTNTVLVIPVDDSRDAGDRFNGLLARAYMLSEDDGVKALLRVEGIVHL